MTHGGLLERKLKCNEINLSAKTQTEIQTFFVVFFFFCLKKLAWFNFFSFIPPICICFSVNSSNCRN